MNNRHIIRAGRPAGAAAPVHAPNAALLIDFDNVTLGIRSDLTKELRTLLNSDIIKGKVAVQRAYADWRRYPQYIVPLSESSIDLIFAPAFGTNKKNATDIRLAVDAIELVFTRPEIGTFILLSGDSDFSSMVIKLKEYGKYVIGVGIRESASDLLIQNCDEYYSYSDLAGLTKEEDTPSIQRDPWELVREAAAQMVRNDDVMRSDRLKQVMKQIDSNFDEKNAGYSRFSKFVTDAGAKGILVVTKMENGQYEIAPVAGGVGAETGGAAGQRGRAAGRRGSGAVGARGMPRPYRPPPPRRRTKRRAVDGAVVVVAGAGARSVPAARVPRPRTGSEAAVARLGVPADGAGARRDAESGGARVAARPDGGAARPRGRAARDGPLRQAAAPGQRRRGGGRPEDGRRHLRGVGPPDRHRGAPPAPRVEALARGRSGRGADAERRSGGCPWPLSSRSRRRRRCGSGAARASGRTSRKSRWWAWCRSMTITAGRRGATCGAQGHRNRRGAACRAKGTGTVGGEARPAAKKKAARKPRAKKAE